MSTVLLERKALKEALTSVRKAVPTRTTIPIIENVRVRASNGTVTLSATDLELSVELDLERRAGTGTFDRLIPFKRFAEHVRKGKATRVSLAEKDGELTAVDQAVLVGADLAEWPEFTGFGQKAEYVLDAADVAAGLQAVTFAVSHEVTRYALTGVLLDFRKKFTAFVASDGKRLSFFKVPGRLTGAERKIIIPEKSAALLLRLAERAAKDGGTVKIAVDKDGVQASFEVDRARLTTKLLEGNFPDWECVVPASGGAKAFILNKTEFLEGLERIAPIAPEPTRPVRFRFGNKRLELFTRAQDIGESKTELPIGGTATGTAVYNVDYLIDFLKSLPKDWEGIRFEFRDKATAAVLEVTQEHKYVLMPQTITL